MPIVFHTSNIYKILEEVKDPEVPVISIIDLGIVRDVALVEDSLHISITPTYSGCPAMKEIEEDIKSVLHEKGFDKVKIITVLSPAWTTDWLSKEGREKLRAYGIAPPVGTSVDKSALFAEPKKISCPQCSSENTKMISQFGSTSCKALYSCEDCKEPFDYFKCI